MTSHARVSLFEERPFNKNKNKNISSGVFRNLKRGAGVYFRCTFSKVFELWHIFTLKISRKFCFHLQRWGGQAQAPSPKYAPEQQQEKYVAICDQLLMQKFSFFLATPLPVIIITDNWNIDVFFRAVVECAAGCKMSNVWYRISCACNQLKAYKRGVRQSSWGSCFTAYETTSKP